MDVYAGDAMERVHQKLLKFIASLWWWGARFKADGRSGGGGGVILCGARENGRFNVRREGEQEEERLVKK